MLPSSGASISLNGFTQSYLMSYFFSFKTLRIWRIRSTAAVFLSFLFGNNFKLIKNAKIKNNTRAPILSSFYSTCFIMCMFLPIPYIYMCMKESESRSVVSNSLRLHGLYSLWNSPGENTGVGNLSLLQGIFLTHGLKPGLPHYRQIFYQLSHKGSPMVCT